MLGVFGTQGAVAMWSSQRDLLIANPVVGGGWHGELCMWQQVWKDILCLCCGHHVLPEGTLPGFWGCEGVPVSVALPGARGDVLQLRGRAAASPVAVGSSVHVLP